MLNASSDLTEQRDRRSSSDIQGAARALLVHLGSIEPECPAKDLGMKPVISGELFDRLIPSVAEAIHPSVGPNDGLGQAPVRRDFRQGAAALENVRVETVERTPGATDVVSARMAMLYAACTSEAFEDLMASEISVISKAVNDLCQRGFRLEEIQDALRTVRRRKIPAKDRCPSSGILR